MASTKLAIVAMLVILLHVSCGGGARHHGHHGKPDPCGDDDKVDAAGGRVPVPGMRHKKKDPRCSLPADEVTPAVMTVNRFEKGQDGGGPAACDGKYHSNSDMLVALSTRWYDGGRRYHRMVRITSKKNGRTVEARVVDECDSRGGCRNNIVDTLAAVWKALGRDTNVGEVPVTCSEA